MERSKEHRDGGKNNNKGRRKEKRISVLYKQFERRYRIIFKVGERTLECREYALAFRCNI
ncbi:hypothetical protein HMPREF9970_1920 [Lachnoanaerobaculum saburreum F0468]|uniref:Uncharacterized protein n=1 Tax=Lachnoanaerobaculum saburreum F0468 TaxID=1095750 RepID=I0RAS0_9FIRM|nr:hypothetical protein HMPREF9970_1920 [Lachnoanaerobaculum saburreum F0468]